MLSSCTLYVGLSFSQKTIDKSSAILTNFYIIALWSLPGFMMHIRLTEDSCVSKVFLCTIRMFLA